jgi:hypothetical protein
MKRIIISILLILFIGFYCFAQSDLQPAAIVNLTKSEPITVRQLNMDIARMEKAAKRVLTTDEKKQVLDAMINERLAIQAAEKDKITISENDLNQQIQQLKDTMAQQTGRPVTDQEFAAYVRQSADMDMTAFKDQMRRQLLIQKYLMQKKAGLFESITGPTENEIMNFYNLRRSQFVRPETVRFTMIQVNFDNDRAKAKALADNLFREIGNNPSKFDEVALRSKNPNSGYIGDDAGYLPRNAEAQQVVGNELMDAAFNLKLNEVSKLITGVIGYQIIKITEQYTMKNLELNDIAQLGTRMTVRDFIANALSQEKQSQILTKATEELVAELRAGKSFQIFDRNINW